MRPGERGQHGEAAAAGAEIQHVAGGLAAEQSVERAFHQWLGEQRARHERALVGDERHALQPRLAGEVRGRAAARDALVDERGDALAARRGSPAGSLSCLAKVPANVSASASSGNRSRHSTSQAASSKAFVVPWPQATAAD
ncbi:MAG: hypothetical protein U1F25_17900 [Rubrivivax sp.]